MRARPPSRSAPHLPTRPHPPEGRFAASIISSNLADAWGRQDYMNTLKESMLHLHGNEAMVLPFRSPAVQKPGAFGSDYSLQVVAHKVISRLVGMTLPTPHPSTLNKAQQACRLAASSLVCRFFLQPLYGAARAIRFISRALMGHLKVGSDR